jgi:hypothetical protein
MIPYKKIEVINLKEIQDELIQYDFFSKTPDLISDDSPLSASRNSGAFFYGVPDLPKLKEFLNSVVHTEFITHYHLINHLGNNGSDIHRDEDNSTWALNIPILNCETSHTVFYNDDRNEIGRITLDVPHFLNIEDCYHQVVNYGNDHRLVISFRFTGKALADVIK